MVIELGFRLRKAYANQQENPVALQMNRMALLIVGRGSIQWWKWKDENQFDERKYVDKKCKALKRLKSEKQNNENIQYAEKELEYTCRAIVVIAFDKTVGGTAVVAVQISA